MSAAGAVLLLLQGQEEAMGLSQQLSDSKQQLTALTAALEQARAHLQAQQQALTQVRRACRGCCSALHRTVAWRESSVQQKYMVAAQSLTAMLPACMPAVVAAGADRACGAISAGRGGRRSAEQAAGSGCGAAPRAGCVEVGAPAPSDAACASNYFRGLRLPTASRSSSAEQSAWLLPQPGLHGGLPVPQFHLLVSPAHKRSIYSSLALAPAGPRRGLYRRSATPCCTSWSWSARRRQMRSRRWVRYSRGWMDGWMDGHYLGALDSNHAMQWLERLGCNTWTAWPLLQAKQLRAALRHKANTEAALRDELRRALAGEGLTPSPLAAPARQALAAAPGAQQQQQQRRVPGSVHRGSRAGSQQQGQRWGAGAAVGAPGQPSKRAVAVLPAPASGSRSAKKAVLRQAPAWERHSQQQQHLQLQLASPGESAGSGSGGLIEAEPSPTRALLRLQEQRRHQQGSRLGGPQPGDEDGATPFPSVDDSGSQPSSAAKRRPPPQQLQLPAAAQVLPVQDGRLMALYSSALDDQITLLESDLAQLTGAPSPIARLQQRQAAAKVAATPAKPALPVAAQLPAAVPGTGAKQQQRRQQAAPAATSSAIGAWRPNSALNSAEPLVGMHQQPSNPSEETETGKGPGEPAWGGSWRSLLAPLCSPSASLCAVAAMHPAMLLSDARTCQHCRPCCCRSPHRLAQQPTGSRLAQPPAPAAGAATGAAAEGPTAAAGAAAVPC
jgi:hypothetical protein